jgi:hypothetical protein
MRTIGFYSCLKLPVALAGRPYYSEGVEGNINIIFLTRHTLKGGDEVMKKRKPVTEEKDGVRIWLAILGERFTREEKRTQRYEPKPNGWSTSFEPKDGLLDY